MMAKDTYYLKHDSNAAHDPKMEAMVKRFRMTGYGRFWRLAEILREQADHRLPRHKWGISTLARSWNCREKEAEIYLNSLISDYELIKSDGEFIWSDRILRDMAALERKRVDARNAAAMRWHSDRNADALQEHSERNAILGIGKGKHRKREEDASSTSAPDAFPESPEEAANG